MVHDMFALWDENKTRLNEIADVHVKSKYLLTRNPADARKTYQNLVKECKLPDMSAYVPSSSIIDSLPQYSFFLQFCFTLATPYLSKDDEEFYIIDNPIKKDKVFKVPMVSGSSWKGNLRWAAGKDIELKTEEPEEKLRKRIQLAKLFGNENESEIRYFNSMMVDDINLRFKDEIKKWTNKNGLRQGRLNLYPTFFNQIGLEVINPHDRETKAGTLPIYIECVPEGAHGTFSLLYVPFDLMGKRSDVIKKEVKKDMEIVFDALKKMMLTYGFSAKKSSGFGTVTDDIQGIFEMSGIPIYKEKEKDNIDSSHPFAKLKQKFSSEPDKVKDNEFRGFTELKEIIERVKKAVDEHAG